MGKRLLLVDDDLGILDELSQALSDNGITVMTADSVGSALEIVKKDAYDVAVVDKKLPDGDGLDLIDKLREAKPDLICILITAHASVDSAIKALRGHVFNYITKPFSPGELIAIIDEAFAVLNSKEGYTQYVDNIVYEKLDLEEKAVKFEKRFNILLKRENRIMELKKEVNELLVRLNEKPKYGA